MIRLGRRFALAGAVFVLPAAIPAAEPAAPQPISQAASPAPTVIAVLDFLNKTGDKKLDATGASIAESLTTAFVKGRGIRVVERSQLAAALQELTLSAAGIASPEQMQRVGAMVGAQFLIVGSIARLGPRLTLNARVQRVSDGILIAAEEVQGESADEIPLLVERLGNLVLSALSPSTAEKPVNPFVEYKRNAYIGGCLSFAVPGSGQAVVNQEYLKGALFFAGFIALGSVTALQVQNDLQKPVDERGLSRLTMGVGSASLILDLWAVWDAWRSARRYNRLRGVAQAPRDETATARAHDSRSR